LKWLYGWRAPEGAFVVPESIRQLRSESSLDQVCEAAGVSKTTVCQWRRQQLMKEALEEIVQIVNEGGAIETPTKAAFWSTTRFRRPDEIKSKMFAYAQAATFEACCERAFETPSERADSPERRRKAVARFKAIERDADRLGYKEEFDKFMKYEGDYEAPRKSGAAKSFFVPTPAMVAFREAADNAMKEQGAFSLGSLPGFDKWFADWVTPRQFKGRRHRLGDRAVDSRHDGQASTTRSQPAPMPLTAEPLNNLNGQSAQGAASLAGAAGHAEPGSQKRGRRKTPRNHLIHKFCREGLDSGKGRKEIMIAGNLAIGAGSIPDPSRVPILAGRYKPEDDFLLDLLDAAGDRAAKT
jgi:hypothetical protein